MSDGGYQPREVCLRHLCWNKGHRRPCLCPSMQNKRTPPTVWLQKYHPFWQQYPFSSREQVLAIGLSQTVSSKFIGVALDG
ncbi:hypothetical protein EHI48_35975 [Rhizobium sp. WSM1325]|nr:hypothetical protein EHI43_00595 [Rhizobium leguminosarum]RWY63295.1 hypothetical protein EHI46_35630 [Rhizobium leguminosarum]RWY64265.1 hypothetical protein EHI48_35975 [Rhizobium leguminosarum]